MMDPNLDQPEYSDSSSSTGCGTGIISSGLDQTESVSLPPLPYSLQAQLDTPEKFTNQNQAGSMKELDSKLNNLRRENFDLKLRLFYERQNKGASRPDSETCLVDRNSNLGEQYRMLIIEHEHQMKAFQKTILDLKQEKDGEIQNILLEKKALSNDMQVVTSLCKSFISHMHQLRTFWTLHPPETLITDIKMVDFLYNWLNSSEDLFNSATVLIGDECDEYVEQYSADNNSINPETKVDPYRGNSIIQQYNLDESEKKREYLKFKSLLYDVTSDSEDNWSEPDNNASRLRIGINVAPPHQPCSLSKSLQKSKSKRLSGSGISSVGPSDSGDMNISERRKKNKTSVQTKSSDCQTLLQFKDIEGLLTLYKNQRTKTSQTQSIQTEDLKSGISSHKSTQTNYISLNDSSSQTLFVNQMNKCSQTLYSSHDDIVFKSKSSISSSNLDRAKLGLQLSKPKTEMPSKTKDTLVKSSKSMQNFSCCKAVKSQSRKASQSVTPMLELPHSLFVFTNKSYASNVSMDELHSSNNHSLSKTRSSSFDQTPLPPREDKKSPKVSLSSKLTELSFIDPQNFSSKAAVNKSRSTSLLDAKETYMSNSSDKIKDYQLPSPDLGIGDSDPDGHSPLRAFLPLSYYQLLRGHLNQISSHLHTMDNLYRDRFVLQSLSDKDFSSSLKLSLNNLNQIINFSRSICKNFVIDDENSLYLQLEKIIAKKENMEKVIARQLKKTDKLLQKAKTNLKD